MIQTFKSILARPAHSVALFVEIVIVTIIGWIAIEPVAVSTTTKSIPAGYDVERLVAVSFSYFDREAEEFDSTKFNAEDYFNERNQLLRMVRNREETASATFNSSMSIEQPSSSTTHLDADSIFGRDSENNDDKRFYLYSVSFVPESDFFKTFGIKDTNGTPFEEPAMTADMRIATRTTATAISHDGKVIGKDLFPFDEEDPDDRHSTIVGVTEDITYSKDMGRTALFFKPLGESEYGYIKGITIRVADGVSTDAFLDRLNADLNDLRCGNTFLSEPKLYADMRTQNFADKQKELNQKWIILGFFLINVFLGIAGTFYVQCRTRIPDAGVMRAFGATRRRIELGIVGEAWLTVFIGWATGSILYLIYLHHQALPMETDAGLVIRTIRPLWYDTHAGRYSVVGGIVLLILLLTATIGAYLPARRVGRTPVVDSLRDE